MSKFIVTGGCGWLGFQVVNTLAARDHEVLVIDNLSCAASRKRANSLPGGVGLVICDIRHRSELRDVFFAHPGLDAVIHLAGIFGEHQIADSPTRAFETNVLGSFNLAEVVQTAARRAPIIFPSTLEVYDVSGFDDGFEEHSETRYDNTTFQVSTSESCDSLVLLRDHGYIEDQCTKPFSLQAISRFQVEQIFREHAMKTTGRDLQPFIGLRHGQIYGQCEFQDCDPWTDRFCYIAECAAISARHNGKVQVPVHGGSSGKVVRDAIHVNDVAAGYCRVAEKLVEDRTSGKQTIAMNRYYNMCGGPDNSYSEHELVQAVEEICGKKVTTNPQPRREFYPRWLVGNHSDLSEVLGGWKPTYHWKNYLREVIRAE